MSTGTSGSDEKLTGSKITPLESDQKHGATHDPSHSGVAGSDHNIDQSRIDPIAGNAGQGRHPDPHADSQGSVGLDTNIQHSKVDPLTSETKAGVPSAAASGLPDEEVDAARVEPMGEVRRDD